MNVLTRHDHKRRGGVSHEVTIAVVLAAAVVLGVAQIASFVAQQSRELERRAAAHRAAGNLMESLMARPWDALTPQAAAALQLPESRAMELREAELRVEVAVEDESAAKRIAIEIDWPAASHRPRAPVRLVAWRFPTGEATP